MASGYLQADVSTTVNLTNTQSGADANFPAEDVADPNWAKITLTTHTERGGLSMPAGGVGWSHLELILHDDTAISLGDRKCKIMLTWDSAGDKICAGPSEPVTMHAGITTTDHYMCSIELHPQFVTFPSQGTPDTLYLWVSTQQFDDPTPELILARLYWYELNPRG